MTDTQLSRLRSLPVKRLPWKSDERILQLESDTVSAIEACRLAASLSEVNSYFVTLPIRASLSATQQAAVQMRSIADETRARVMAEWDSVVDDVYGVDSATFFLDEDSDEGEVDETDEPDNSGNYDARAILSYFTGCIFGRWDIRFATGEFPLPQLLDPFAPLPKKAPGSLELLQGHGSSLVPEAYPMEVNWDGVLVDDPDHHDDIIRRIRDILELIWGNRADAIEKEACEVLGVKELRDYFRKPGNGGFWDDHVSRYSKSRRKAPIYWLLQSSKKNYALWLYYHRLDKDILFKALLHYVEPKIRLEESRLDSLRSQRAEAGTSGKGAKILAKDIDRQEEFISELRDFEDKLRRVVNLHLDPDLNDGVVLNIAPLQELVPWKEAKTYWDELLAGKYEWSSIGKQLRDKGLVKSS